MRQILLFILAFGLVSCEENNPETIKKETVLSVIHSRKSVRNFKNKIVPEEDINSLIKAAMAAPTAVNLQPWHFVVVNKRETLDSLHKGLPLAKMLPQVSHAIIVCGDTTAKAGKLAFWRFDCSLASANILLAAEAMGLGAVWTAVYPDSERIAWVRKQLNLPEHIIPLNLIPIGYPTGEDKPKDKYNPEKIHYNNW